MEVMVQTRSFYRSQILLLLSMSLKYASLLPAPQNLSIQSVNMRHLLKWSPLQAACGTVNYSVKFQGEYETHVLNGSWVDAHDCQEITQTECDLTLDLGSDSDYSVGVRAQCDGRSSWTQLPTTFNRRDTELVVPNMSVSVMGNLIQVGFSKLLPQISIKLRVWREGDEKSVSSTVIRAQPYHFSFDTQQAGGTLCVTAEALLESINKSSSTETHCVSVQSPAPPSRWLMPVSVSAAVVITVAVAVVLGWKLPRYGQQLRRALCHKEPLPRVLLEDWPTSAMTFSSKGLLEPTHSVILLHPLEAQD